MSVPFLQRTMISRNCIHCYSRHTAASENKWTLKDRHDTILWTLQILIIWYPHCNNSFRNYKAGDLLLLSVSVFTVTEVTYAITTTLSNVSHTRHLHMFCRRRYFTHFTLPTLQTCLFTWCVRTFCLYIPPPNKIDTHKRTTDEERTDRWHCRHLTHDDVNVWT